MTTTTTTSRPPLGSVLVTGGCGFLGSHIVRLLLERYTSPSTTVSVFDLNTSRNTYPGAQYHKGDLTSLEEVRRVFADVKPNVVIHTASPVFGSVVGAAARKRAHDVMRKVNVDGTKLLVAEAKAAGCEVFVYTSSASVSSDTVQDLINADERYDLIRGKFQKEYYSDTKAEAEELVLAANTRPTSQSDTTTFLTTALRPAAMFGEGDVQLIPNLINVLKSGRTGWQIGDNENLFDYTYVGNVAHAHILAAAELSTGVKVLKESPSPDPEKFDPAAEDQTRIDGCPFIITNHSPVYFWDFARAVWAAYARHASPDHFYAPYSPWVLPKEIVLPFANIAAGVTTMLGLKEPSLSPPRVRYACMTRYYRCKRATQALGYRPVWDLSEGVERTARWFADKDREEKAKKGQ